MFNHHSRNLSSRDSSIRFVLATILSILAVYTSCYILLLVSMFIYYTAISKFCFLYYYFKINERFSVKNYYLSFLPKHNPSAVFIFGKDGNVVFKNNVAESGFDFIKSIWDLNVDDYEELILNNQKKTIIYRHNSRSFQIELLGVSDEKILLAYFRDVTEIFELNEAIEETQKEVIYAMGEIGETRSKETGNHVKRVALYSELLANLYGLDPKEAQLLKMASPMHDIGKVAIADAILNAPRKLTDTEFKIMKTHASIGYDMLKKSNKPILQAAAIVAYEHHEKFDGTGYPHGKSGENIHIFGRITAIADVFDALGSDRVYKKAWDLEQVLEYFRKESGKHFDPLLTELFLNNLDRFLIIRDKYRDR